MLRGQELQNVARHRRKRRAGRGVVGLEPAVRAVQHFTDRDPRAKDRARPAGRGPPTPFPLNHGYTGSTSI